MNYYRTLIDIFHIFIGTFCWRCKDIPVCCAVIVLPCIASIVYHSAAVEFSAAFLQTGAY